MAKLAYYGLLGSLCVAVWVVCVEGTIPEGPCFDFPGNSFVHFTPNNFNNRDRIHYMLQFSTTQDNGVLMYASGPRGDGSHDDHSHGDDEALYIRDGFLNYHIFNSAPSGVGGQFGGHFRIPEPVNIGDWVTVHVYRLWQVVDSRMQRNFNQTGIVATINGQTYDDTDNMNREDINISPTIYFGGYRQSLSATVGRFLGQMRYMSEEKNDVVFETPSLNYESKVNSPCQ